MGTDRTHILYPQRSTSFTIAPYNILNVFKYDHSLPVIYQINPSTSSTFLGFIIVPDTHILTYTKYTQILEFSQSLQQITLHQKYSFLHSPYPLNKILSCINPPPPPYNFNILGCVVCTQGLSICMSQYFTYVGVEITLLGLSSATSSVSVQIHPSSVTGSVNILCNLLLETPGSTITLIPHNLVSESYIHVSSHVRIGCGMILVPFPGQHHRYRTFP